MINLYTRIESDFKKKSKNRKAQTIFILAIFAYIIVMMMLSKLIFKDESKTDITFIVFVIAGAGVFWGVCYSYILWSLKYQYKQKLGKGGFLRFEETIQLYHLKNQERDVEILKEILNQSGVNTRPKVLEVLRHYQCMIPRNVSSGQLLSVLALIVAVFALLTSEHVINSVANSTFIVEVLILTAVMYLVGADTNKRWFSFFGKKEFYLKLEGIISEIYINYHIKEKMSSKKEK